MTTHQPGIEQHPDLVQMRARFERATTSPRGQVTETLALLTGLYLAASPWIVGFHGLTTLAVTNLICGVAFALCLGGFGSAYERTHAMAWCAIVIGTFVTFSPWIVAGNVAVTGSVVSNVVTGMVAVFIGVAMAGITDRSGAPRSAQASGGRSGGPGLPG
ncbi:SPW repeat protein [Streptomyces pacificus]|uniref:SPW repeat protein n=1 Tax=Streptomyces pacificus TaxID=2705029 RepID=A0A6A0AX86_9ACTN|nr:SPW repeat protein [Streptomyces pacificus]GFH37549.1 SPW repeat protein [Streptomyces pacificus]